MANSQSNKNLFDNLDSSETQKQQQAAPKRKSNVNFQREFVDEAAPTMFDLIKTENTRQNPESNYYQSKKATWSSMISNDSMVSNQSYFKLRNNVKTVLVTQEDDDWIFNLNIGNVMHL